MADSKITALTAISTVDPTADPLVIVDVSDTSMAASGTTKKSTINQLLGSGGTATLASATITGALGAAGLNVTGATIPANGVYLGSANNLSFSAASTLGMTLNSTGLGVGTVPSGSTGNSKISIVGGVTYDGNFDIIGNFTSSATASTAKGVLLGYNNSTNNGIISAAYGNGTEGLTFWTHNGSSWGQRMELTATGNVGIGVTPSAWISGSPAVQLKYNSSIWAFTDNSIQVNQNAFYDGAWKYINAASLEATNYFQNAGKHIWRSAIAGTAGNTITWTTAMTLDASGNLILLSSNTPATLTTNGQLTVNATSNTNLRFSYRGSDGVTRTANLTLA